MRVLTAFLLLAVVGPFWLIGFACGIAASGWMQGYESWCAVTEAICKWDE
ncbi:MAG TPA: hypothetical protein VN829_24190 [Dongiaceae bacterium]|nr:hypothetical protein [Dongiaceae bacterium]